MLTYSNNYSTTGGFFGGVMFVSVSLFDVCFVSVCLPNGRVFGVLFGPLVADIKNHL